jgi:hypothetical protein
MLILKKKYQSKTMSNGKVSKFNTNDIVESMKFYYFSNGFSHIFNIVCDNCIKVKCVCND